MTGLLFATLAQFIINPTYETGVDVMKAKPAIMSVLKMQGKDSPHLTENCNITYAAGRNAQSIVLGMTCVEGQQIYQARLGIDYIHKIYMKKRFYPSNRK